MYPVILALILALALPASAQQTGAGVGAGVGLIKIPTPCSTALQQYTTKFNRRGEASSCVVSGIQTDRFPMGGTSIDNRTVGHWVCMYGSSTTNADGCVGSPLPFGGTLRDLVFRVGALEPGDEWNGRVYRFDLGLDAWTPTALNCNILHADSTFFCRDVTNSVAVSAGDILGFVVSHTTGGGGCRGSGWSITIDP